MNFEIRAIDSLAASTLCATLSAQLPDWFGIPEANRRYQAGVLERVSIAAYQATEAAGLLTLEFPYPGNAHIYWMAVSPQFHGMGVGAALIIASTGEARERGADSITVETLSPIAANAAYLQTYAFYLKCGFRPLFDLTPYGSELPMVYLQKRL